MRPQSMIFELFMSEKVLSLTTLDLHRVYIPLWLGTEYFVYEEPIISALTLANL